MAQYVKNLLRTFDKIRGCCFRLIIQQFKHYRMIIRYVLSDHLCSTLMSTKHPTLQKRYYPMDSGQEFGRRNTGSSYYTHFVDIPYTSQACISLPPIRMNSATRFYRLQHERVNAFSRGVGDPKHTNSANPSPIFFCRNDNQSFFKCLSASDSFFKTTQVSLVDFYSPRQTLPARPHHSPSDFMQPRPCRFVASYTKDSLKSQSTSTILLSNHPPDGPKPHYQRFPCTFKNCSSSYGCLISATDAFIKRFSYWPTFGLITTRATKSVWPTQLKKIVPASFLRGKACLKFGNCSGIVFHTPRHYILCLPESSEYPHLRFGLLPTYGLI